MIDSRLINQAYEELYGVYGATVSEDVLHEFYLKNQTVLQEMQDLVPVMIKSYWESPEASIYDPEPYDVFVLSAPQHLKHKLKK